MTATSQNLNCINHIAFVIDGSDSMTDRAKEVIKVVDDQIAHLARRSKELDQETRVTIYIFNNTVECIFYDKDVLRLPSIANFYRTSGMTALIDATIKSQKDLALTPEIYGDHSFLTYVFTDGEENRSLARPAQLMQLLKGQPDHWTVGVFVPDAHGMHEAKKCGFPTGNIMVWNIHSASGISEVGETIRATTDAYMTARSQGIRGTRTLFSTGTDAVNADAIKAARLKPMANGTYDLLTVPRLKSGEGILNKDKKQVWELQAFILNRGLKFAVGRNYYRLSKQELINGDKDLAIREKSTNKVFVGDGVRAMIGLSDKNQRVAPDKNPDFDIFVQSKSSNRHLFAGDEILVLK